MRFPINTRVIYTLLSAAIILTGSFVVIRYANGTRVDPNGKVQNTGLLAANSFPPGASIFVDGKLVSATDSTLYLDPGSYQVEIRKDGYASWQKSLKVEKGLVTQTNAQLFRLVPSLTPLTFAGISNVAPSPDGQKILFYTASSSASTQNGLYLLDLSNDFLTNPKEARKIADATPGFDLNTSSYIWSPDNSQILLSNASHDVLLDVGKINILPALPDVSFQKKQILSDWESQLYLRERQFFSKFPDTMIQIATQSAKNVYLSPDKKKMMYTATAETTLPDHLVPPLLASSTQPEQRHITANNTYVYDREEDKNFLLSVTSNPQDASQGAKIFLANDLYTPNALTLDASPSAFVKMQTASTSAHPSSAIISGNFARYYSSLYSSGIQWFPDSRHVLFSDADKIYLMEYDDTNKTAVYSGPYADHFVYPWPDGSKILILTTFSSSYPMNLYGIELK